MTNRTFHFGARVLTDLDGIGTAAPPAIKELIRTSFFMLLTGAVGEARRFYSAAYVRELERRSPFTFEFLRSRRRRFTRKRGILERLVGTFAARDVLPEANGLTSGVALKAPAARAEKGTTPFVPRLEDQPA